MSAEQDLANAVVKMSELVKEVQLWKPVAAGLANIYPTITEGRQNTDDGKYFSVPASGTAFRLYRRQGTSAELISEFPDATAVNAVLDQLGPLLGRGVVGGSGDLMAQGYSGLGGTSREIGNGETVNLKTFGKGFYFTNRPASDSVTGLPSYIPDVYSLNIPLVGSSPSSIINSVLTILPTLRRIILGVSDGTETGLTPFEVYTSASVVGQVSESEGLPTGALFESDSNSFGSWTDFADGTREMLVNTIHTDVAITTTGSTEGSLYRSSEQSIVLPLPIVSGAETGFSINLNNGSGAMIASSIARTRLSGSTLYFTVVGGSSLGLNTFATTAIVKTRWF
ncbi:hypothetical protein [Vreelandella titanicae]|uniref:hypothetical protein n=1 Tax=Vreelandella titanicae TaxID=664683 RepID=UPI0040441473